MGATDEQQNYSIKGGVMTGVAVIPGPWMKIVKSPYCSFQAVWTGNPTGTFAFDISDDPNPNLATALLGATPLTLPASFTAGNPVGAAGSFGFEFGQLPYLWIRIKYTNSGGAGTLNVGFVAKG